MNEVRRWKLKGFIPGIEGETRAVFHPTVVLAEDYDAALAREAALREELAKLADDYCNKVDDLIDIQQRLTVAEKRESLLKDLLTNAYIAINTMEPGFYLLEKIDAALKPAEGEGS